MGLGDAGLLGKVFIIYFFYQTWLPGALYVGNEYTFLFSKAYTFQGVLDVLLLPRSKKGSPGVVSWSVVRWGLVSRILFFFQKI